MSLGDYMTGLGWFALTGGSVAATTALVASRQLRPLRGAPRGLAIFVVAVAALVVVHLVPLMLGALTRATPALTGAVLCLAAWRLLPRGAASEPPAADEPPPSSPVSWALALAVAGAAAIAVVGYAVAAATQAFTQVDVVAFHLPGVARWIQTGSVWQIDQFLPYQAQGNYPNSGDVVALAVVLPWHDDFALRFVGLPFVAATGVAVYALGRELGAPAAAAVIYGAVAVTIPSVAVSALDFELPDAIMYSTFATGVLFLLRRARGGGTLDVGLAGIALGVAFGVKWYAVWAVAVVVAVWAAASLLARRPWRAVGLDGARLGGLIALFGGFWLLRNLVESGNPFFPARVAPFGVTVFDAPYDRYRALAGFPLSDYFDDPSILRHYALPAFNRTLGLAWVVSAAGALVAAVVALRGRRPDWRVVAVGACAALLAVAYLFTPYSALGGRARPPGWPPTRATWSPPCSWARRPRRGRPDAAAAWRSPSSSPGRWPSPTGSAGGSTRCARAMRCWRPDSSCPAPPPRWRGGAGGREPAASRSRPASPRWGWRRWRRRAMPSSAASTTTATGVWRRRSPGCARTTTAASAWPACGTSTASTPSCRPSARDSATRSASSVRSATGC